MKEQNRLVKMYKETVVPALLKEFKYANVNEVPKLVKIVLNMGLGDVKGNSKSFNIALDEMQAISGQKPVATVAKKSISNFGLR
jgi:large subunit ribosomal protein L5